MNRKLFLSFMLVAGLVFQVFAQDRTISGKVVSSEDGTSLPGVSIAIKGTTRGATTNADGIYSINTPSNSTLVFSFLGFDKQEIAIGSSDQINVTLKTDVSNLNEVVVIGYGVQRKSKLTSSISKVAGKDLANLNTTSFDQQLAGRAAGVQVTVGSGIIGQAARIRIRGTNSITSGGSPLIVVD